MFEKEDNESRKGAKVAGMDGNGIGKEIVDAAMMKEGITRTVNGLPE